MEYDHGRRITPHYHEMSPLERAIAGFEEKAKSYYRKTVAPASETHEQREKREKALDKALAHLKAQRLATLTQVQVQTRLEDYREALRSGHGATR